MKKVNFTGFVLLILMISFFVFKIYQIKTNNSIEFKAQNNENSISLLTFIFQPSLNENCEVVVDFEQKILIFKSIYPERLIESRPKNYNKINEFYNSANTKPFVAELSENQIENLTSILKNFREEDFKRIEQNYIDGISYNFSLIYSNNTIRTGNIASDKTTKQLELVNMVLHLVSETNEHPENTKILRYYYDFSKKK